MATIGSLPRTSPSGSIRTYAQFQQQLTYPLDQFTKLSELDLWGRNQPGSAIQRSCGNVHWLIFYSHSTFESGRGIQAADQHVFDIAMQGRQ